MHGVWVWMDRVEESTDEALHIANTWVDIISCFHVNIELNYACVACWIKYWIDWASLRTFCHWRRLDIHKSTPLEVHSLFKYPIVPFNSTLRALSVPYAHLHSPLQSHRSTLLITGVMSCCHHAIAKVDAFCESGCVSSIKWVYLIGWWVYGIGECLDVVEWWVYGIVGCAWNGVWYYFMLFTMLHINVLMRFRVLITSWLLML